MISPSAPEDGLKLGGRDDPVFAGGDWRLGDVIDRAGGLTETAFAEGFRFYALPWGAGLWITILPTQAGTREMLMRGG